MKLIRIHFSANSPCIHRSYPYNAPPF
jgi:hypothetical protein